MTQRNNKKKILITGASGLLGSNLALFFRERYAVTGVVFAHTIAMHGVSIVPADLSNRRQCRKVIQEARPDIVIHCAALANVDTCEDDTALAELLNHHMSQNIVESVLDAPCKLIYISTDAVYEGTRGDYRETDIPAPVNYYGRSKLFGEQEFLRHSRALIVRTNFFGWNVQHKEGLGEWVINRLVRGEEVRGFEDTFFTSLYTFDLARILEQAFEKDVYGTYNLASCTPLSKYEFAVNIAKNLAIPEKSVIPTSMTQHAFRAPRGVNLSMNVSKLETDLGTQFPTFEETIQRYTDDYKIGFLKQLEKQKLPLPTRYIPYGCQSINQDDIDEVSSTLRSAYLTQGPKVAEFEKALATVTSSQYVIATNSATSALHIACLAGGIQEGDEVITSPITFVASANCAFYCGATPVFADIDSRTYTVDPHEIAKKITLKTRAVIPVHLAGQSCNMRKIRKVVQEAEKKFNTRIVIIEDASHSIGSLYNGKPVGSCEFSDMAIFSFHPVKHITTGEGGAICTNDEQLAKKLYRLRSHGITSNSEEFVYQDAAFSTAFDGKKVKNPWYYEQIDLGYNYRLTDMQAALGVSQLDRLARFRSRRKEIIKLYNDAFCDISTLMVPFEHPDCDTNFHLYILLWDFDVIKKTRAEIMHTLREKGIQTQVHYIPIHTQPYYQKHLGTNLGQYPKAEKYYQRCLSLPLHPSMSDNDVARVVEEVRLLATKSREAL